MVSGNISLGLAFKSVSNKIFIKKNKQKQILDILSYKRGKE